MIRTDVNTRQGRQAEADAWRARAEELADWTIQLLVNRTDRFGRYNPIEVRGKLKSDRTAIGPLYTGWNLSRFHVLRHYRGCAPQHVIGLHSTSAENTCRSGAFDVDRHSDAVDPRLTWDTAMRLYREAQARGFRPLLTDSNGRGGYHLRTIFREPVPSRDLHHLLRQMALAAGFRGEQFPKQPDLDGIPLGNWLRLPGRHHTRDVWAEAFDGERWLAGADAVAWLLSFTGDDPALVPACPPPVKPEPRPPRRGTSARGCSLKDRIAAYVARCPNKGEGEGRDVVAFGLAGFLVRDLCLSDDEALTWLSVWDEHNAPPKGDDRLREIIANAHAYGRHAYGCGLKGDRR
jgi:putative DNA primase/helicase